MIDILDATEKDREAESLGPPCWNPITGSRLNAQ
jgi:hypothetical protein